MAAVIMKWKSARTAAPNEVYVDAKTGQLLDMGGERDRDRDEIEVYPDYHNGGGYDPHGYYGYYGNHGHGEGYYEDDRDDDDDD